MTDGPGQLEYGPHRLTARLTPWDERALHMRTAEFQHLHVDEAQPETAASLFDNMEQWCNERSVRYVFGRIDARQTSAKTALLRAGYTQVECSITLSRAGFAGLPRIPERMRVKLCPASDRDQDQLSDIARTEFVHGRFLEDPAISDTHARERSANWIADLTAQHLAYVARSGEHTIGFHAERVSPDGRHADLILTGTSARYAMLSIPLWVSALESLADRGVETCSTLVSAANTGVINLYARLGFHFDTTLFGYRKFL